MQLSELRTGDLIYRTKPSERLGDRFMDTPVRFVDVENNLIIYSEPHGKKSEKDGGATIWITKTVNTYGVDDEFWQAMSPTLIESVNKELESQKPLNNDTEEVGEGTGDIEEIPF